MLREDIAQYNHLRARIMYNAPALHGAAPRVLHHGYSVLTSREASFGGDQFQATLIAFSGPSSATEGILLRKSRMRDRLVEAMEDLLDSMEQDLGRKLMRSVPGHNIAGDETPKASRSPRHRPKYEEESPTRAVTSPPGKPLSHSRSTPIVIPELFRDRSASHYATSGNLRSQQSDEPLSPVPPLTYKPYRKPVEPEWKGYIPYRQPPAL